MEHSKIYEKIKSFTLKYMPIVLMFALIFSFSSCSAKDKKMLMNSQAYYDSLKSLEEGNKVIVFLLDGFGYSQYEQALNEGRIPFIESLGEAKTAGVYQPSISNVGLAALTTGKPPNENSVKARGDMDLNVSDVFNEADKLNKSAVLIEGDVKLINTSAEPVLNPDDNNNGFTDDEVYNTALQNINGYDYIFVHFHGIDDVSHSYGPKSHEALERVFVIDGYIKDILISWQGMVIITADHGQHENESGAGEHGTDLAEDIEVPYLFIKNTEVNDE